MNTAILKKVLLALGITANVACLFYYVAGRAPDEAPRRPAPPARLMPNASAPRIVYTYSPEFHQTDVYTAEDLVLVDESGRRLLLSPIYSATGRGAAKPAVVHFRLYSFSETTRYDGGEVLRMVADGREVWASGSLLYSHNVDAGGRVVEHLGGAVPFEKFAAAVMSDDVRLAVGREEIRVSWGPLDALRRMAGCARGDICL